MMEKLKNQFVWAEAFRPQKIADCVLPDTIKRQAEGYVKQGKVQNLILAGTAGTGKTSLARCIANELGADFMIINASMEGGIDTIRTKILNFASTVSFSDSKKITLLDEADFLTPAAQASLRAFIEEFGGNHSIIMTCNFKNRLIEPLHSRAGVIDFKIPKAERVKLASQFFKRVTAILDYENVEYDKKVVAEVVNKHFPDFRRCLNELQRYASSGKIDSGILLNFSEDSLRELFNILKTKKFNEMRKWVAQTDVDTTTIFRSFYDLASEYMEPKSIPTLVLVIGEYQYKAAFVADQEINISAFLTEVLLSQDITWK